MEDMTNEQFRGIIRMIIKILENDGVKKETIETIKTLIENQEKEN